MGFTTTRAKYRANVLEYQDSSGVILERYTKCSFRDEFLEYTTIPADGSRANGCPWVQEITGAAPPTVTLPADAENGTVQMALTSAGQAQQADIHWDDNRHFAVDEGELVFQCRFQISVMPTDTATAYFGLGDDNNALGIPGNDYHVGLVVGASGALTLSCDDNSTDTAQSVSGTTVTTSTWYNLVIDMTTPSTVKFFLDGAYLNSAAIPFAATGTSAVLQPILGISKANPSTGVGTVIVDSVDIWSNN